MYDKAFCLFRRDLDYIFHSLQRLETLIVLMCVRKIADKAASSLHVVRKLLQICVDVGVVGLLIVHCEC